MALNILSRARFIPDLKIPYGPMGGDREENKYYNTCEVSARTRVWGVGGEVWNRRKDKKLERLLGKGGLKGNEDPAHFMKSDS